MNAVDGFVALGRSRQHAAQARDRLSGHCSGMFLAGDENLVASSCEARAAPPRARARRTRARPAQVPAACRWRRPAGVADSREKKREGRRTSRSRRVMARSAVAPSRRDAATACVAPTVASRRTAGAHRRPGLPVQTPERHCPSCGASLSHNQEQVYCSGQFASPAWNRSRAGQLAPLVSNFACLQARFPRICRSTRCTAARMPRWRMGSPHRVRSARALERARRGICATVETCAVDCGRRRVSVLWRAGL